MVDFRCNQFASLRFSSARLQLKQPALVKAFLPKSPVETLDERVVGRFARATELKLYFSSVGPFVKSFRGEFGTIVNMYHFRQSLILFQAFQHLYYPLAAERSVNLDCGTNLTGVFVDKHGRIINKVPARGEDFVSSLKGDAFLHRLPFKQNGLLQYNLKLFLSAACHIWPIPEGQRRGVPWC